MVELFIERDNHLNHTELIRKLGSLNPNISFNKLNNTQDEANVNY